MDWVSKNKMKEKWKTLTDSREASAVTPIEENIGGSVSVHGCGKPEERQVSDLHMERTKAYGAKIFRFFFLS